MLEEIKATDLFKDYYAQWVHVYKEGAIRDVTLAKYKMAQSWLEKLIPNLKLCEMTRINYQQIIKGKTPVNKKIKYLNQFELHELLTSLHLGSEANWDYFILLVAKTGMRFSEALALTPKDFDFAHQTLSISKTWNYRGNGGFALTKNKSSVRKIQIDWQTVMQFAELTKNLPSEEPIFVKKQEDGNYQPIYNSTVNGILERYCKKLKISTISVHGLRHTHASILLFAGVSIGSVARRLGHASMTTTQKTYLHIIQELENQDIDLVMRSLANLT